MCTDMVHLATWKNALTPVPRNTDLLGGFGSWASCWPLLAETCLLGRGRGVFPLAMVLVDGGQSAGFCRVVRLCTVGTCGPAGTRLTDERGLVEAGVKGRPVKLACLVECCVLSKQPVIGRPAFSSSAQRLALDKASIGEKVPGVLVRCCHGNVGKEAVHPGRQGLDFPQLCLRLSLVRL